MLIHRRGSTLSAGHHLSGAHPAWRGEVFAAHRGQADSPKHEARAQTQPGRRLISSALQFWRIPVWSSQKILKAASRQRRWLVTASWHRPGADGLCPRQRQWSAAGARPKGRLCPGQDLFPVSVSRRFRDRPNWSSHSSGRGCRPLCPLPPVWRKKACVGPTSRQILVAKKQSNLILWDVFTITLSKPSTIRRWSNLNKVTAGIPATILLKCEFFNPAGSVKDRIGMSMIETPSGRGILKKETSSSADERQHGHCAGIRGGGQRVTSLS